MTRRLWLYGLNAALGLGCLALVAAPATTTPDAPVGARETHHQAVAAPPPSAPFAPKEPAGNPFRAAAAPVVAAEAPVEPAKPTLRLIGIIDGPGQTLAVLQMAPSEPLIRAHIGDRLAPWTLAEINRKSIVLEGNGVRSTLLLDAPVSPEIETNKKETAAEPVGQAFSIAPSSIIQRIKR